MKRLVLLIALITLPLYLFAETVTVTVTDRDLDIPLEGVTITLRPYEFETVTDENGVALVELPDDADRAMVFAELPGYQSQRVSISGSDRSVAMVLSITDVIEGRELVVERSARERKTNSPESRLPWTSLKWIPQQTSDLLKTSCLP